MVNISLCMLHCTEELSRSQCVFVVKVHGKIYVVGGRNNSPDAAQDSPAVDCFDPRSNCWSRCADMTVARNRVGVAALDCLVYAVGGSDRQTHHASVERYHSLLLHPWEGCEVL